MIIINHDLSVDINKEIDIIQTRNDLNIECNCFKNIFHQAKKVIKGYL